LSPLGYIESFKRTVPMHLKVAFLPAACSVIGTVGAVLSAPLSAKSVKLISTQRLKLAIAVLTMVLGILTIVKTLKAV